MCYKTILLFFNKIGACILFLKYARSPYSDPNHVHLHTHHKCDMLIYMINGLIHGNIRITCSVTTRNQYHFQWIKVFWWFELFECNNVWVAPSRSWLRCSHCRLCLDIWRLCPRFHYAWITQLKNVFIYYKREITGRPRNIINHVLSWIHRCYFENWHFSWCA